jgi:tetratricopeptide (TPR) repeat protein
MVVWAGLPAGAQATGRQGTQPDENLEKTRRAVEELLARPHVELDALLEAGTKLAEQELFEPARALFARGVNDYPRSFDARYNLALADFALGRFAEAQRALDGAEQLSKDQQLAREYLRGKIYDALGKNELAEQSLTAAFRGSPQQENYALDLGLHYLRLRLYAKALATFQAAAEHHPDSIYVGLGLALAQVFGDDPPRAVATCRKILAHDPSFGPGRLLLVVAFYMNGENENCARESAAFLEHPGAPPYLYYLHAASLLKMNSKDHGAMLRDLDTANHSIPDCAFCYFARSKVHQEMGDEGAAITDLEALTGRVDPEFAQGWYRLANLYQRAGKSDEAGRALARFRAIKTAQTDRETDYLRKVFLDALK